MADLAHFCEARTRTTLPEAWCAMYVRSRCHRHICKTFLLSQDFLSFSLPHQEGLSDSICSGNSCLNFVKSFNTWRTRRKQRVLGLGLLLHLCGSTLPFLPAAKKDTVNSSQLPH